MSKQFSLFVLVFLFFIIPIISQADAHSLFNSGEQTMGSYRVQIATLPEFPQIDEDSKLLLRITDLDYNEVDRFTMGIKIYFNGEIINVFPQKSYDGSHWETVFVFENSGNHIVEVNLYDDSTQSGVLTYNFNISTQSPFGYIFIISIATGGSICAIIFGYIYLLKRIVKPKP